MSAIEEIPNESALLRITMEKHENYGVRCRYSKKLIKRI